MNSVFSEEQDSILQTKMINREGDVGSETTYGPLDSILSSIPFIKGLAQGRRGLLRRPLEQRG